MASASVVKAHDKLEDSELLSASVRGGAENVIQAGVLHVTDNARVLAANVSTSVDLLTGRANLGLQNDDGSKRRAGHAHKNRKPAGL